MTVHWHDDEIEWCPCDEPEGVEVPTIWNDPDNNADAQQAGGAGSVSVHDDSPTNRQFHVRYRVRALKDGPYWSHVYDDEETAREVLASFEADADLTDVGLWVRVVTPWRQA